MSGHLLLLGVAAGAALAGWGPARDAAAALPSAAAALITRAGARAAPALAARAAAAVAGAPPVALAAALAALALAALALARALVAALLEESVPVVRGAALSPSAPEPPRRVASLELSLPSRPGVIQCYAPGTLRFLGEVPVTDAAGVAAAVARARVAQSGWARSSFSARRRVLRTIAAATRAHADAIVRLSAIDTGKTAVDAAFGELLSSLGKLDWVAGPEGEDALRPEARAANFMTASMLKRARVEYAPLGVLGVIAPWNYPFYNMVNHVASGLFAGNAVVVKMSEHAAWSASKYGAFLRACLKAAGAPEDLVQVVHGFGPTGAALVASVDKVIFTGSPGVGRAVAAGAARTLTPCVLELGGKDPLIVCDDANLAAVVPVACRGVFQNAGQNCVGVERVYAYDSVHDAFVAAAVAHARGIRVGASVDYETCEVVKFGVDMGAVTMPAALPLIQALVDDAVAKGATLHCGGYVMNGGAGGGVVVRGEGEGAEGVEGAGASAAAASASATRAARSPAPVRARAPRRGSAAAASAAASAAAARGGGFGGQNVVSPAPSSPPSSSSSAASPGLYYAPTVLSGVTHDMRIANEEVFGPVMCVLRVPNDDDAAAAALANSTAYGLGATVFSGSPSRGAKLARALRSGMVGVNAYGLNYLVQSLPFGGVGESGYDRFSGREGLRACALARSVVDDALPGLALPMAVPRVLQYPLGDGARAYVAGLLDLLFGGRDALARARGLATLTAGEVGLL